MWPRNAVLLFLVSSLLFSFPSCSGDKPGSTGIGSEIIVVAKKSLWNGAIGDSVRALLMQNIEGLPETEPEFTLIFCPEESFSINQKTHRNILFIEINSKQKKRKVETLNNVWASPQRVVKIKANSDTACIAEFSKHAAPIKELFNLSERSYYRALITVSHNTEAEKTLADKFGIQIQIPKDLIVVKKAADFMWLRTETDTSSIGLFIYTMPYKDTSQLAPVSILETRDRFTKLYLPGPSGGAYMMIEREAMPPVSHQILFKSMYANETRGLWRTKGDFMGGPFINYTIVDAPRQRIIILDGYVYFPNEPKRNFCRQLESIIWGAEFGNPAKKN